MIVNAYKEEPTEPPVEEEPTNPPKEEEPTNPPKEEKPKDDGSKNPKTGAFISIIVIIIATSVGSFIVTKTKKTAFR